MDHRDPVHQLIDDRWTESSEGGIVFWKIFRYDQSEWAVHHHAFDAEGTDFFEGTKLQQLVVKGQ